MNQWQVFLILFGLLTLGIVVWAVSGFRKGKDETEEAEPQVDSDGTGSNTE